MCLARVMNFSRKTSGLPNAASDSRWACSKRGGELVRGLDDPHAAAAAAHAPPSRSPGSRASSASCLRRRPSSDRRPLPPRTGTFALLGDVAGGRLVAELLQRPPACGPTKVMPASCAGPGERRVLGEKAVARVDRIDAVLLGERDDAGDVQVRPDRLARLADQIRLVRLEAVQGEAVLVRVDGDGANAQFVGRRGRRGWRSRCDWRRAAW